jgi:hypothetical protein
MDNKKILSKLVKIASNQQAVLNKLAQTTAQDPQAVDDALNDFLKYQLVSWGLPREIAAKESHTADRMSNSTHYDVNVTLTLSDKTKKSVVEDPAQGFAAWLTNKFVTASKDPKWKALDGYTATFKVTAN